MKKIWGKTIYETADEILKYTNTGIIVVDMQNDFAHLEGHFAKHGKDISAIRDIIPNIRNFLGKARENNIPIIYIQQTTLPDGKSDSSAWLRLKTRDGKTPEYTLKGTWGEEIIEEIKPERSDVIVKKFRPDAFVNTPLDHILRCSGIESVIIIGVTTEGCLESTVRGASYHDYYVIVAEDCVASTDKTMHLNSLHFMKARYTVVDSKYIVQIWEGGKQ